LNAPQNILITSTIIHGINYTN